MNTRKLDAGAKAMLNDMRRLKRSLLWNRIKGRVPPGQDPNQLSLQLRKRKGLRNFLFLKM